MRVRTPWIFTIGAGVYEQLTNQQVWRDHVRRMVPMIDPQPGARVLDLGIGPGVSGIEMAKAAPQSTFVGIDLEAAMVTRAKKAVARHGVNVPLVQGDVAKLPFADASFDGATAHSFFYLLPDRAAALAEVRRVLKPGARVAFLEPGTVTTGARAKAIARAMKSPRFAVSMFLWSVFSGLHGRWTDESLTAALSNAGFAGATIEKTLDGLGLFVRAQRS